MKTSKCCNANARILETGEFSADVAREWAELECQQCGEIYFEDEPKSGSAN